MLLSRRRIQLEALAARVELEPVTGHISVGELTVSTDRDDTRTKALLLHIGELSRGTQQLQIATISYINFAGLISVGALTVGIIKPEPLVGIFAPYALTVVLVFLLQLYTDIERLITLREVVEGHLNKSLGSPAFLGTNLLSSKHRGRTSVRLVSVLLAFPLAALACYSFRQTAHKRPRWDGFDLHLVVWRNVDLHWVNVVGLAFCSLVIGWAGLEMIFANSRAVREAELTLGKHVTTAASKTETDQNAVSVNTNQVLVQ